MSTTRLRALGLIYGLIGSFWGGGAMADPFDHTHAAWNKLLQQYVVEQGPASKVRYAELKQNAAQMDRYLSTLSQVQQNEFNSWGRAQRLAFLVNAYNAFTLKLVLDHYPLESIKDIGNLFRSSWKIKFIPLLGEKVHLDYIEHDMIRGNNEYAEPRIHFALVCASVGCPKLQARAFTAQRLDEMLERGAQEFLSDHTRNRYDAPAKRLHLSSIFKWYGEDFEVKYGSVRNFVAPYLSSDPLAQKEIRDGKVDIEYLDYDWSLNDAR